ncbi:MAG TPA: hypothetical protein PKZ76_02190 [Xanthomonadaceae bacterium]|nr:hypothetical protein [Xanthomonadaceae bacterium]
MHIRHSHLRVPAACRGSAAPAAFLFFLGLGVGAVAVMLGGNRVDLSGLGRGGSAAVLHLAALQLDTQRLAIFAQDAAAGNFDAFDEMQTLSRRIDEAINSLRSGDEKLGLARPGDAQWDALDRLARTWHTVAGDRARISERQALILDLADAAHRFSAGTTSMLARLDSLVNALLEMDAPGFQVHQVNTQTMRAMRMQSGLRDILRGDETAFIAADRFARDATAFGRVLDGMLHGNEELRIARIDNEAGVRILSEIHGHFSELEAMIDEILTASTELFEVKEAAETIRIESERVIDAAAALAATYR